MYKNKTRVTSRVAVAVALSLGITVGAVGVASASPVVQHHSVHGGHGWMQSPTRVEGMVSSYTAGLSISIVSKGSTTPEVYALTSATVINGLAIGVTLASPTNVDLVLSPSTPTTVTSIFVDSNAKGKDCGHGSHSSNKSGSNHGAVNSHRSHRFGSSQHGHGRR